MDDCLFERYIALVRRYATDKTVIDELNNVRVLLYQQREPQPVYTCPLGNVRPRKVLAAPVGIQSQTPRRTQKRQSISLGAK